MDLLYTLIILLLFPFIFFPILIFILSSLKRILPLRNDLNIFSNKKTVSIVIPIFNEEKNIDKKIKNLASQHYSFENVEVIFYSDGSSDNSEEIINSKIKEYPDLNIRLLKSKENLGRATAHNNLVREANNEFIIFTDIETHFEEDFIKNILEYFNDKDVGMAVGRLTFLSDDPVGIIEKVYFRIESFYRKHLSSLGLLLTGTGAAMAIRKQDFVKLRPEEDIDDSLPLIIAQENKKIVFSENSVAFDYPVSDISNQFWARARMSSKGFSAILYRWRIESLYKHFFLTLTLICHKLLKWLTGLWIAIIYLYSSFRTIVHNDQFSMIILSTLLIYFVLLIVHSISNTNNSFVEKVISIPFAIFGAMWGVVIAIANKTKHGY